MVKSVCVDSWFYGTGTCFAYGDVWVFDVWNSYGSLEMASNKVSRQVGFGGG